MLESQLLFQNSKDGSNAYAPEPRALDLSFEFTTFRDDYSGRLLGPRCRKFGQPCMALFLKESLKLQFDCDSMAHRMVHFESRSFS
jgi:hypothetical protein